VTPRLFGYVWDYLFGGTKNLSHSNYIEERLTVTNPVAPICDATNTHRLVELGKNFPAVRVVGDPFVNERKPPPPTKKNK